MDIQALGYVGIRAKSIEDWASFGTRFLGMQLGHAPVVDILAAAHRIGEVYSPVVAFVDVGQGGGDTAFCHDGMGLAQERLAHQSNRHARGRGFNGGSQARAASANDKHIVIVGLVFRHAQIILQSLQ